MWYCVGKIGFSIGVRGFNRRDLVMVYYFGLGLIVSYRKNWNNNDLKKEVYFCFVFRKFGGSEFKVRVELGVYVFVFCCFYYVV